MYATNNETLLCFRLYFGENKTQLYNTRITKRLYLHPLTKHTNRKRNSNAQGEHKHSSSVCYQCQFVSQKLNNCISS